jgi:hypothetical protein
VPRFPGSRDDHLEDAARAARCLGYPGSWFLALGQYYSAKRGGMPECPFIECQMVFVLTYPSITVPLSAAGRSFFGCSPAWFLVLWFLTPCYHYAAQGGARHCQEQRGSAPKYSGASNILLALLNRTRTPRRARVVPRLSRPSGVGRPRETLEDKTEFALALLISDYAWALFRRPAARLPEKRLQAVFAARPAVRTH